MPDHDVHRQPGDRRRKLRRVVEIDQEFDVPAERCDRVGQCPHHVERTTFRSTLVVDEIEPHPADARLVERADLIGGDVRLDHRDAAQVLTAKALAPRDNASSSARLSVP